MRPSRVTTIMAETNGLPDENARNPEEQTQGQVEYRTIFRPYITLKNGKRLYAWQKGLKAFPLRVRVDAKK